ncbi:hypothetical protein H1R20_g11410, partial [Candolleomyces eurysporus]
MSSELTPKSQSPIALVKTSASSDAELEPYHGLDDHESFDRERSTMDGRFHQIQLTYLEARRVEYLFATAEQKKEIALSASNHLIMLVEKAGREVSDIERAGMAKNVREWFSQKCRKKKDIPEFGPRYTGQSVFAQSNKTRIAARQRQLFQKRLGYEAPGESLDFELDEIDTASGDEEESEGGLPDYGGKAPTLFYFYKKALKYEWDLLTRDDQLSYEKRAAEWREHGVTEEEKARLAEKDLVPYVERFCHTMFKHLGVRVAVLCGRVNLSGELRVSMLDFNQDFGGVGFKQNNREAIKNTGVMPLWAKYNASVMGLSSNPYEVPWELKVNGYGEPLLKDPMNIPDLYQRWISLPKTLRAFIKGHYACASGRNSSKVRPPWGEMFKRPRSFFSADHVPDKYLPIFRDPSKVDVDLVEELLNLFYSKQKEGKTAFEFHSYLGSKGVFNPRLPREAIQASSAEDGELTPLPKPKPKKRAQKAKKPSPTQPTAAQKNHQKAELDGAGEKVKLDTPTPTVAPIVQVPATPALDDEADWEDVLPQVPVSKPTRIPARKKAVVLDSDGDTADLRSLSAPATPMESMPDKPPRLPIQSMPAAVESSPLQPIFSPTKQKTRRKAQQTLTMQSSATPLPAADATPPPITPPTIDSPINIPQSVPAAKRKASKRGTTKVAKGQEPVGGSSAAAANPSSSAEEKALLADAASLGALEMGKRVRKPRIRDS